MNQAAKLEQVNKPMHGTHRESLREFQSQLIERMQRARSSAMVSTSQLGVMIGQTRYLLNLRDAGEIVSVGHISPVPLTRDWYLGLLNVRGNLIGVIDIQRFQQQPGVEINADCRVIAFSPSLAFNAGLLVTQVLGLRNVAEMKLQHESSQPNQSSHAWLQQRYIDTNQDVWHELNLATLTQDSGFLHISL